MLVCVTSNLLVVSETSFVHGIVNHLPGYVAIGCVARYFYEVAWVSVVFPWQPTPREARSSTRPGKNSTLIKQPRSVQNVPQPRLGGQDTLC